MADIEKLISLLKQQAEERERERDAHQRERQLEKEERERERESFRAQNEENQKLVLQLLQSIQTQKENVSTIPPFEPFKPAEELWIDYERRFQTFTEAHLVPKPRLTQVFLTNQSPTVYKQIDTWNLQQSSGKLLNDLEFQAISSFLAQQYDPKYFALRERFHYYTTMKRLPGETIRELAVRTRKVAINCNFVGVKDPLDEALRIRFICSVNNDTVLRSLFNIPENELTFDKAVETALQVEESNIAVRNSLQETDPYSTDMVCKVSPRTGQTKQSQNNQNCFRCGKTNHNAKECTFKDTICRYCNIKGHIETACLKKKAQGGKQNPKERFTKGKYKTGYYKKPSTVHKMIGCNPTKQMVFVNGKQVHFEVDSGAGDNFCTIASWKRLGKPTLTTPERQYRTLTGNHIPILGRFEARVQLQQDVQPVKLKFNVSTLTGTDLLGRNAIALLNIDVRRLIKKIYPDNVSTSKLKADCLQICKGYRKTADHGNADALSRIPCGREEMFDKLQNEQDLSNVCTIKMLDRQFNQHHADTMIKESRKDPIISTVIRYLRDGWPRKELQADIKQFQKLEESLHTENGCLFFGSRIIVPNKLRTKALTLLHEGHFGMQRMKQLARTIIYWPCIDKDIENMVRSCRECAIHQNNPPKAPNHPWAVPEKPWSRLHIDHAVNFMGRNWLVLTDAYSKYPCIHITPSMTTKATTELLEADFAHFGYPHTLVTDNAAVFHAKEFQEWCKERGITHLTGAPYHPATNGAAERLVQTFKQSLRKSKAPIQQALHEFLLQYRRTPLESGYSPAELLNGRQIRSKIDVLLPQPQYITQRKYQNRRNKSSNEKERPTFINGTPCLIRQEGPHRDRHPKWIPGTIVRKQGPRTVWIQTREGGQPRKRHIEQIRPRMSTEVDYIPSKETHLNIEHTSMETQNPINTDKETSTTMNLPEEEADIRTTPTEPEAEPPNVPAITKRQTPVRRGRPRKTNTPKQNVPLRRSSRIRQLASKSRHEDRDSLI